MPQNPRISLNLKNKLLQLILLFFRKKFMAEYKSEEKYIIDESAEISGVGFEGKILKLFPAFKNRNYKIYFAGQLISLVGTWLQIVAEGWLVFELTHSAFWVGVIAALTTLPTLLFSLFGGVIVDRLPKKRIILFSQTGLMFIALVWGILTVLGIIEIWQIAVFAFLLGTINAIDMPARHAFVYEMVGKDLSSSAVALNSGAFNLARIIGPGIAGFLIAFWGPGITFILNGVSYVAAILALLFVHTKIEVSRIHSNPIKALKEGIVYSFSQESIRILLFFTAVVSVFGWSYGTVLPVIAKETFHTDATGLGFLYSYVGVGAIFATIVVSAFSAKKNSLFFILGGNTLFAVSMFLFTFTNNLLLAFPFLFLGGLGILTQFSVMNTSIQNLTEDRFRGRVMSIYLLMFVGLFPVGNFQVGFLSEHFGTDFALRFGAVVTFVFGVFIFLIRKRIQESLSH